MVIVMVIIIIITNHVESDASSILTIYAPRSVSQVVPE